MKKTILTLAILAGLCSTDAFGQQSSAKRRFKEDRRSAVVHGVAWYYRLDIVRSNGSQTCCTNAIIVGARDDKYMGDLSIPASLDGYSVTRIAVGAFCYCKALTSIVIPNSVVRIDYNAFDECCSLTNATLSECLQTIPDRVFYRCNSLTSVIIPATVTSIGQEAFYECDSLTSVAIPASVIHIGHSAFGGCSSLTNVVMSDGVESIADHAFSGCHSLSRFDVPSTVVSIGDGVLSLCSSLEFLSVATGNKKYKCLNQCIVSMDGRNLIAAPARCAFLSIPKGVKVVPRGVMSGNKYLADIELPDSIMSIEDYAFCNCRALTNAIIPASVRYVGEYAYGGCNSLRNVKFLGKMPIGVGKSGLPSEEELKKREEESKKREEESKKREEEVQKQLQLADKEKRDAIEREKEDAERKLWSTWPRGPNYWDRNIVNECELSNNVVLVSIGTNEWYKGCGKGCVVRRNPGLGYNGLWERYDANGGLVRIAPCARFPEYVWMTNRAEQIGIEMRKTWATEHGMTYEEAKQKYKDYQAKNAASAQSGLQGNIRRPNFLNDGRGTGSLRERRMERERQRAAAAKASAEEKAKAEAEAKAKEAQREAERAAERTERDREREEQRAQLLKTQEELKKAREAKATDVSSEG